MPRKRFTNEQIAFALRQSESGSSVEEICRKMGVSEPTLYRLWTALPLQVDFDLNCLARCKHLSGVTRSGRGAQMGNPLAHTFIAGRPRRPR